MITFADYILEAYLWEGPPPPGAQLFHYTLGFPKGVAMPLAGMRLSYGPHARQEALNQQIKAAPKTLPAIFQVIEVEAVKGRSTKWVVRFPMMGETRDMVLVIGVDGFVRTMWANERSDTHKSLRRGLYTLPGQVTS
jgi:hypothetical protein